MPADAPVTSAVPCEDGAGRLTQRSLSTLPTAWTGEDADPLCGVEDLGQHLPGVPVARVAGIGPPRDSGESPSRIARAAPTR